MRIASPCRADWAKMSGDERARFCAECQLHVYNIAGMTRREAEELIGRTEGRICARFFKRADGTVLTKDCPVGLRALRRRLARVAGAAFTAVLSLTASAIGQTLARTSREEAIGGRATATTTFFGRNMQQGRGTCWGIITDPNGATVAKARVTISNEKTKYERTIKSDKHGQFRFGLLEPGFYTLKIEAPGFQDFMMNHLSVYSNEELRYDVALEIGGFVGIVVIDEPPTKGVVIEGVRVRINEE